MIQIFQNLSSSLCSGYQKLMERDNDCLMLAIELIPLVGTLIGQCKASHFERLALQERDLKNRISYYHKRGGAIEVLVKAWAINLLGFAILIGTVFYSNSRALLIRRCYLTICAAYATFFLFSAPLMICFYMLHRNHQKIHLLREQLASKQA